jgi:hypothetical protein
VKRWASVAAISVAIVTGIAVGASLRSAPAAKRAEAVVMHDVVARDAVRVDLYLPVRAANQQAPFVVIAHDRGFPAPDERARSAAAAAVALQRRGIAVAVAMFDVKETTPLRRCAEETADAVRAIAARAGEHGIAAQPVLVGDELGATLVALVALDPKLGLAARGVVTMNGLFDGDDAPVSLVRADAPPFLVLSAHGESPHAAQSSRSFARALERAGAKSVRAHHVSNRDARSLANLSGDRNDVADLVAAFVRGEPTPGGPDGEFFVDDTWGASAPLSSEGFGASERRPMTDALKRQLARVMTDTRDLDPWPRATFEAIDLGAWLSGHGTGDFVVTTNARGEQIVMSRSEIERKKPVIVVGIDDETNLFRMFVTYNVYRTYSWKPETGKRSLLVRHVGAFLHFPDGSSASTTGGDFALTPASFKVVATDPLAPLRSKPFAKVLTDEQGCAQCHASSGVGPRAHHLRATDGKLAEAYALALEEYPREVLRRFLFEQDDVAQLFGVGAIRVPEPARSQLFAAASAP